MRYLIIHNPWKKESRNEQNNRRVGSPPGLSAVVLIGVVLLFITIRSQNGSGNSRSSGKPAYQTTTVQRGTLTSTVEGTGTVASMLSANLNWKTGGQVDKVNVLIGDQVKAGDVLATLLPGLHPEYPGIQPLSPPRRTWPS